uniref:Ig-like domain-containing protein n=1 Tax=Oryzias latipes TaxID=8090 RepID=A0A3B3I1K7_ORYLA
FKEKHNFFISEEVWSCLWGLLVLCDLFLVSASFTDVTLPCGYNISTNGEIPMCWGKEGQYFLGCRNELIATDGSRVKEDSRASSRYQLLGRLDQGDVSLTIRNVTEEDSGLYACRVKIPGIFNDELYYMDLSVVKGETRRSEKLCERTKAEL